jgi:uncharacterized iron-regulated membrane protein
MGFIDKPRRTLLRKVSFQAHLWSGFALSLYIAAVGITGSILVFKDELQPKPAASASFRPDLCTSESLLNAMRLAAAIEPHTKVRLALCPTETTPFYTTTLEAARETAGSQARRVIYSEATSGRPLASMPETNWLSWIEDFHSNLLAGRTGRLWNGVGSVVLALMCVTGLVVWWPGIRMWKRAMVIHVRAGAKRIIWDLHSCVGFWTLIVVLMWALTGVSFAWPKPIEQVIGLFSPVTTAKLLFPTVPPQPGRQPSLNLPVILDRSVVASPHGRLAGLFFGLGPGMPFTVYMARKTLGDYTTTDFVYFDPYTGAYLDTWHRGEHRSRGDAVYWLLAPLHFGTSWGKLVKIAWALLGLTLPGLSVTGLLMYWNRHLSKQFAALANRR